MRWFYKECSANSFAQLYKEICKWGDQGWELVTVFQEFDGEPPASWPSCYRAVLKKQ